MQTIFSCFIHTIHTCVALLYLSLQPEKTHFISKSLVFQFDSHLLPFTAYFVFFSICHWNKIRRRRCQLCIHVAVSRVRPSRFLYIFHCIYSILKPPKIRQNEHITRRERSTLSSSSNHHHHPRTRVLFTVCIIVVVRGSFIDSKTLTVVRLTYLSIWIWDFNNRGQVPWIRAWHFWMIEIQMISAAVPVILYKSFSVQHCQQQQQQLAARVGISGNSKCCLYNVHGISRVLSQW